MRKIGVVQVSTSEFVGTDGATRTKMVEVGTIFQDPVSGKEAAKLEVMPLAKIGKDGFPAIWLSLKYERGKA